MSLFKRITDQIGVSEEKRKRANLREEFKKLLQENMDWAREEYAEESEEDEEKESRNEVLEQLFSMVQKSLETHIPERIVEEDDEEDVDPELIRDAKCLFHISEDKMKAYTCILPPINGGKDMDPETFAVELRYAGITYGIDAEMVAETIKDEDYLSPFLVAEGTPAQNGKDGLIRDNFKREKCLDIDLEGNVTIDFNQELVLQTVSKDAVICVIQKAEKAIDGKDVVGKVLKGIDGKDVEISAGPNTYFSDSGTQLLAQVDGAISITKDGDFCVKPQRTVTGHAGRHTGNLYHKGDMYITGNVSGDIVIRADGNLIIGGEVKDAQITAGKNIRIQKGVSKGMADTIIKAQGQIQAAVIDNVMADADGDIYAGVIVDSDVTSGGSIHVTSDRGLIIGGEVKARQNVSAKEIGNISECRNSIKVGYDPEIKIKIAELQKNIKDGKGTLDMLQKNISTLKAVGASHLPPEKKDLLGKLEEQRTLYENRATELEAEIKHLKTKQHKASAGSVSCEKMYPSTEVYIGEKKTVIQRLMEPCRVFITGDNIVAR